MGKFLGKPWVQALAAGAAILGFGAPPASGASTLAATVYKNGFVWDGTSFSKRRLTVRAGRFAPDGAAGRGARVVDLRGAFVVPAYANAHSHITRPDLETSWAYVRDGVFYVWNPNTVVLGEPALAFFRRADTYDVAVSQGGITEPRGHPEKLYVEDLAKFVYKGMKHADFLGNAFHYGRSEQEIDAALERLTAQKADFVKAYLLHSEEYAKRRDDSKVYGGKGLNPANVPYLVSAAKARGLKVAFHVETVSDLRTAAAAGAGMAAHVPGYVAVQSPEELRTRALTREDAEAVARSGILLVPTFAVAAGIYAAREKEGKSDPQLREMHFALQARNLRLLKAAGAKILTGTDGPFHIFNEAEHMVAIGGLTAREALQMVLETGRHLFPTRRIGCFDAGCEADFLVLSADPQNDVANLRKIARRIKAGQELKEPAPSGK